jgi:hypothetical protein
MVQATNVWQPWREITMQDGNVKPPIFSFCLLTDGCMHSCFSFQNVYISAFYQLSNNPFQLIDTFVFNPLIIPPLVELVSASDDSIIGFKAYIARSMCQINAVLKVHSSRRRVWLIATKAR